MVEQYLRANVFVSPSTIENSSNSIGEAMLLGCPVVASYVGGTPSLIDHEQEGLLYQVNSKEMLAYYILKVLENDGIAMELSHNSQKRAKEIHNIDANNATLKRIYEEIAEKAKRKK